jgi:hypothetical protein
MAWVRFWNGKEPVNKQPITTIELALESVHAKHPVVPVEAVQIRNLKTYDVPPFTLSRDFRHALNATVSVDWSRESISPLLPPVSLLEELRALIH